jgi:hypothetical protein
MTTLRFILAVATGTLYSPLWGPGNVFWRAKDFFWLWWDSWHAEAARPDQMQARMAKCRECPIFFRPLRTCGSPFHADPKLGCWCQMDAKARMVNAHCWLRLHEKHRSGFGWEET